MHDDTLACESDEADRLRISVQTARQAKKGAEMRMISILIVIVLWTGPIFGETASPARPERDWPSVEQALAARTDLWGELAMRQRSGPSYSFFEQLLPPLRYVEASFRHYPIVLAAPFGSHKSRLISNGSGINVNSTTPPEGRWARFPLEATFYVGQNDEPFGADVTRLQGPQYENGCLPVCRLRYQHNQGSIVQESFVPTDSPFSDHAVVAVRFILTGNVASSTPLRVRLQSATGKLTQQGSTLLNAAGQVVAWFGQGWSFQGDTMQLTAELQGGTPLAIAICSVPLEHAHLGPLDSTTYDTLHAHTLTAWNAQLARCMRLTVAEELVNRAWKAVIVANLMLATGDEMTYSAGNAYTQLFEAESGDAVRALLTFGLLDTAKAMTNPLLRYEQAGLDYHDAAFKLQLLCHVYWLTRDADYICARRELWRASVDRILNERQPADGLLPPENFAGDIATKVTSLNSNANSWRGLRDIAAVLQDIGEREEAQKIASEAAKFRTAILAALDKSEVRDTTPPFVPVALFGAEKPHDPITADVTGSYWNLLMPYVLGSGILDERRTRTAIDYLHQHGGIAMGMMRFHQHSGLFANENGVDDLYSLRYVQALLKRDDVDRALVSFYGKLAQGFTRDTFVGGEGSGLIPIDSRGRGMYLPPNASGNAFFLTTLRELLMQDQDMDDDGTPETLRLLFATPRSWLADGKTLKLENAPTAFGAISVNVTSALSRGELIVEIEPPAHAPKTTLLRLRLPDEYVLESAAIGSQVVPLVQRNMLDVSSQRAPFRLHCVAVKR